MIPHRRTAAPFFLFLLLPALLWGERSAWPSELLTPAVVEVNRQPMRAHAFAYEDRATALRGLHALSLRYLTLDGLWRFHYAPNPAARPRTFFEPLFDDQAPGWGYLRVPANWEVNGYGYPIYLNQHYDFIGKHRFGATLRPPFDIPADDNPVGSYRRHFELPTDWQGKQVFIHLGAVKAACFLWINGHYVGYSEDSKLAAEFDITPYIQSGRNTVALQVYRWADASYLECQDMFRFSGIERGIYLFAREQCTVWDFKADAGLTPDYRDGTLALELNVRSFRLDKGTYHATPDTFGLRYELMDARGNTILADSITRQTLLGRYHARVRMPRRTIPNVEAWCDERPYLYTLCITLTDGRGRTLEVIPHRIGFRSVEIKGSDVLINGRRVFFKGVNRHETHPTRGHVLTREEMRKDIEMMKRLNINSVRNAHYPPDPHWLELCDEYGLYVIDEANIESHGRHYDLAFALGNDPLWRVPHIDRVRRMYERDKNFPSVITWSLGNEAGNGANFYEAYDLLKLLDSRPVQYERAEWDYNTDIICPQYPNPDSLLQQAAADTRPYIMSEYAHIMGNSLGNFEDYWKLIEHHPRLQGGYIWEWADQGIDTVKHDRRIVAYGGDFPFGNEVHPELMSDNNFCVKGVVTGYRTLTPMAHEVKKVYQPVAAALAEDGRVVVRNKYFFRTLGHLRLQWELLADGRPVEHGTVETLRVEPRTEAAVDIPWRTRLQPGREYLLNVRLTLKAGEPLLPAGYEVAAEQLTLQAGTRHKASHRAAGSLTVEAGGAVVRGRTFHVDFDTVRGTIRSYRHRGRHLFGSGPTPAFWRAPVDNDFGAGLHTSLRAWRRAYETAPVAATAVSRTDTAVHVRFTKLLLNGNVEHTITYTVYPDGAMLVHNRFVPHGSYPPYVPLLGNTLELEGAYSHLRFYGRGPEENTVDRRAAAPLGIYTQHLREQYFPYARPQESGGKTDVRHLTLTDERGRGVRIECCGTPFGFTALPYSLDDLDPAPEKGQHHSGMLTPRDTVYLRIDHRQSGVGGVDSWHTPAIERYRVRTEPCSYAFWLIPVDGKRGR